MIGPVAAPALAAAAALALAVSVAVPLRAQAPGDGGAAADQEGRRGGAAAPAGPIPRTPDGKPDLTGSWNGGVGLSHTVILEEHPGGFGIQAGKGLIIDPPDGVIPYQPWALAERNRRREDINAYEDPVGHCEFYDIGRLHSFAQSIQDAGNRIIIWPNQHFTRVVAMDRREHLPEGIRLWLGDPIGRWDGDRKSTRLNSSHGTLSRMPSSA